MYVCMYIYIYIYIYILIIDRFFPPFFKTSTVYYNEPLTRLFTNDKCYMLLCITYNIMYNI